MLNKLEAVKKSMNHNKQYGMLQVMFHPLERDVNSYVRNYPLRPSPLARSSMTPKRHDPVAIFNAGQPKQSAYSFSFQVVLWL